MRAGPAGDLRRRIDALPHPRVLVLSGGGGNGAAEAGAVERLYEAGYRPDLIVGTSIGAWNAAFLAANNSPAGARHLVHHWHRGDFAAMSLPRPGDVLRSLTGHSASPVSATALDPVVAALGLDHLRWESLPTRLVIGAVEVSSGNLIYASTDDHTGPLLPWVRASSGLTPLQPLGEIDGRQMADAGFRDNYGVRAAVTAAGGQGPGSLLILDAAPQVGPPIKRPGQALTMALGLLFHGQLQEDVTRCRTQGFTADVIPVGGEHSVLDYFTPQAGIRAGRAAADSWAGGHTRLGWPKTSDLRRLANVVCFAVRTAKARQDLDLS